MKYISYFYFPLFLFLALAALVNFSSKYHSEVYAESSIIEYQLSFGSNLSSIAQGSDGSMWYTAIGSNKVGKISQTGHVTEYEIPSGHSRPTSIVQGPDGNMWFTEFSANKIARITPNGVITEFQLADSFAPNAITSSIDNHLWFSSGSTNKIGKISLEGTITYFLLPASSFSGVSNITVGSDGKVWFTESNDNEIGHISDDGSILEYLLPQANSSPQGLIQGSDGNIWFAEYSGNRIGRINAAGLIEEFSILTLGTGVERLALGSDGNIWFTESNKNKVGKITTSGDITEYTIPEIAYGITSGLDGDIWFTMYDKIGRFDPSTITNPSPTSIPTPTPNSPSGDISLNVPLFKQGIFPYADNNPSWEAEEFDHAGAGQFTCGVSMAQCGCATTSLAMILNYHGITKLPDGSTLTPGSLNTWMKNNNGYDRNLGVIWPVVSTLSKKAKAQNPNFTYDALEFDTDRYFDPSRLSEDLQNGIPNILQVDAPGMHFIVAKGSTSDNSFTINDPLFNKTSLIAYNNTASSVRRFVPSHTDLSYVTYIVDEDVDIYVRDRNSNVVAEGYLEYSPAQLTVEPFNTSSSAIKVLNFAKPETGEYTVELHSATNKNFQLDEYVITEQGDSRNKTYKGVIKADSPTAFTLTYDKQTLSNTVTQPVITFDKLQSDLQTLYKNGQIKNKIIYTAFLLQVEIAERASLANRQPAGKKIAILTLKALELELNRYRNKLITENAYQILYKDIESLIKILKKDIDGSSQPGGSSGS